MQMMREDSVPPNEVTLRAVLFALENAPPPPTPPPPLPPPPPPRETRGQPPTIPVPIGNTDPAHPRGTPAAAGPPSSEEVEEIERTGRQDRAGSSHALLPWEMAFSLLRSMAGGGLEGPAEAAGAVFPGPRDFAAGLTAACFGGAEWSSIAQVG